MCKQLCDACLAHLDSIGHTKINIQDKGVNCIVDNPKREIFTRIKIDDVIGTDDNSCDFLLFNNTGSQDKIYFECKTTLKDISHIIKQFTGAYNFVKARCRCPGNHLCYIVYQKENVFKKSFGATERQHKLKSGVLPMQFKGTIRPGESISI